MKVTFSRPPTTMAPVPVMPNHATAPAPARPPAPSAPPAAPAVGRRRAPPYPLIIAAGALLLVLLVAVAWLWSLLAGAVCQGVVGCETITLRAPTAGRIASLQVALGERVRSGARLLTLRLPEQAGGLAALRERRAAEARALSALEAGVAPAAPQDDREQRLAAARTALETAQVEATARAEELKVLRSEAQAASEEVQARQQRRERMELLVRLSAAQPDDVEAVAAEERNTRSRAAALEARLATLAAGVASDGTQLAAQRAEVERLAAVAPVQAPPPPPASQEERQALRARLASLDAELAQAGERSIVSPVEGTVLELPALDAEVAGEGKLAVVAATGRLWIDAYLAPERGERARRTRSARVRGLLQELPLPTTPWRLQAVPPALRPWLADSSALSLRLDVPVAAPFIPGQVVELTLR